MPGIEFSQGVAAILTAPFGGFRRLDSHRAKRIRHSCAKKIKKTCHIRFRPSQVIIVGGSNGQAGIISLKVAGIVFVQRKNTLQAMAGLVQNEIRQQPRSPAIAIITSRSLPGMRAPATASFTWPCVSRLPSIWVE